MNAVGIDVSKGRSTVAILRPMGEVVMTPEDVGHSGPELKELAHRILSLGGDTRVVMEATGRYHEPIAAQLHEHGIFVSVVNPLMIYGYSTGGTVRKVKTDEKDASSSLNSGAWYLFGMPFALLILLPSFFLYIAIIVDTHFCVYYLYTSSHHETHFLSKKGEKICRIESTCKKINDTASAPSPMKSPPVLTMDRSLYMI